MISLPAGCGAVDGGESSREVDRHRDELHLLLTESSVAGAEELLP